MDSRGSGVVEAVVASSLLLLLAATALRGTLAIGRAADSSAAHLIAARLATSAAATERAKRPPDHPGEERQIVSLRGITYDVARRWRPGPDPALWRLTIIVGWRDGARRRNLPLETWVWDPSRG